MGENTSIEGYSTLLSGCSIGCNCKIHRNVFVDNDVRIGNNVKIQNNNSIYRGVTLEDGVFMGPHVTFTNDKNPRAITFGGKLKTSTDWVCSQTKIEYGASIGGGSTIVCGITIGKWAMVGAGAVVTKNVPPHALVVGNPARVAGWVSESGFRMTLKAVENSQCIMYCEKEKREYRISFSEMTDMNEINEIINK